MFLRLALQDRRPFLDLAGRYEIDHFHFDKIAASQLAVDSQSDWRQVALRVYRSSLLFGRPAKIQLSIKAISFS